MTWHVHPYVSRYTGRRDGLVAWDQVNTKRLVFLQEVQTKRCFVGQPFEMYLEFNQEDSIYRREVKKNASNVKELASWLAVKY